MFIRTFSAFILPCLGKYYAWGRYPCKESTSDWRVIISEGCRADGPTENKFRAPFRTGNSFFSLAHDFIQHTCFISIIIIIIIIIQPLGRFWQEPEPSQATGMALARCILGKFLRVVCHCFPLPLDVLTFVARCLHVTINASAASSERWKCGREWSGDFAEMTPFYAI
jgi:hypothetical protein